MYIGNMTLKLVLQTHPFCFNSRMSLPSTWHTIMNRLGVLFQLHNGYKLLMMRKVDICLTSVLLVITPAYPTTLSLLKLFSNYELIITLSHSNI